MAMIPHERSLVQKLADKPFALIGVNSDDRETYDAKVEEMGGMNVFFVRKDRLITPPLEGTILPGVTRDCILQMARMLDIPAEETHVTMEQVVQEIRDGVITEAIACGTAAAMW